MMVGAHQVAVEIEIAAPVPGGGAYRAEELPPWTFDGAGKVARLRRDTGTAKQIAAAPATRPGSERTTDA